MESANLELSKSELAIVINSDFILTKNRIIEKIYVLFGVLSKQYKMIINDYVDCLPGELLIHAPKIYKGEQYKNLPYVMLDYPRQFSKTDIFAIRSFFWWGNYFSITLHISGKYLLQFGDAIFQSAKSKGWYTNICEDEWEHDLTNDNCVLIDDTNSEGLSNINSRTFLKIAKKISINNWQQAEGFYEYCYKDLLEILCAG